MNYIFILTSVWRLLEFYLNVHLKQSTYQVSYRYLLWKLKNIQLKFNIFIFNIFLYCTQTLTQTKLNSTYSCYPILARFRCLLNSCSDFLETD